MVLLFICVTNAAPSIEWQKSLGGSSYDLAYSIQQTGDGGYIVAGHSNSDDGNVTGNHGDSDYWVVKLNAGGDITWQTSLGGLYEDYPKCIQQTGDGGYVVAGHSNSDDGNVTGNHGDSDYWVVKLNAGGDITWQTSLGGSSGDHAYCIQQTLDGGYIVAGNSFSNDGNVTGNHGGSDYWIVKLDAGGDITWQTSLGGSSGDFANSIQQTLDGGYIVAGGSYSNDGNVTGNHGGSDYWVVKLDAGGDITWQTSLGGSSGDFANSIQQTLDGGYIVAGYSNSDGGNVTGNHGGSDYWVVKLDAGGDITWQTSLGGSGLDNANRIQETLDGGYIVAGYSYSNDGNVTGNHGRSDYWVVKLDAGGTIIWQKSLGGSAVDLAFSIQETLDGGYIVAGYSYSNDGNTTGNHGESDYWVVKLSPDNAGRVTVSSVSPVSGLRGKTASLSITGSNFTAGSQVSLIRGSAVIPATNVVSTGGKKITCKAAIPAGASTGPYDVRVINNIEQQGIVSGGFTVFAGPAPTISTLTPNTLYPNVTWNFTLAGTNFRAGAAVTFNHPTFGPLPATASMTDSKKITGTLTLPLAGTTGKWDLTVTNPDGRTTTKKNALTVKPWGTPAVTSSLQPSAVYKNATTHVVLNGKYFEPGLTTVFFNLTGQPDIPLTNLTVVSPTKINGTISVPGDSIDDKWNAVVITADGGTGVKKNTLTIKRWPKPTISTVTPGKTFINSTVPFTVGGMNFQDGAVVFFNRTGSADTLIPTNYTVISTKKITGTLTVPPLATYNTDKWNVIVTTPDGGTIIKSKAFQIIPWSKPAIGVITPASGTAGTPVSFTLTGTYFQADATAVVFNRTGSPDVPATGITVTSRAKLTGNVTLPDAGKWNLFVTTVDGGTLVKKSNAFTVK